ncbi:TIR domain-containing protein [Paracoccus sp. S3-43]|uniref:TIR domain-containing protein n=1 Tax=Paracoccus sp. S3-43 TaxID=3030011 RepID=UPI0023AF5408|nr:TIR domain-containing protein [Paracoccus sp. S3-43]WEF23582.1 hypothetical protein PXD02_12310 [Paracoccus sp. S3-43]
MEIYGVEDVFVTEGVPEHTFVRPPNYGEILVDIRRPGKPVIVEGQSGTGKTTAVKKIIAEIDPAGAAVLLTPRNPKDISKIEAISLDSGNKTFIIDDFHRLPEVEKERLANIAKVIAEADDRTEFPKIVIIGINNVGADLIELVHDIAKRIGIHRIQPGSRETIAALVNAGCQALNIRFVDAAQIFEASRGDYWLAQQLAKTACVAANVTETSLDFKPIDLDMPSVRHRVVQALQHTYDDAVRQFCRGAKFRPTNDPYFKLLRLVGEQGISSVDLNELANAHPDVRGSINNVKDVRLPALLASKPICAEFFYYNSRTKNFAIEDPALFFYIQNLDWDDLRRRAGFRNGANDYEHDIAISFAGENRALAQFISEQLGVLDIGVFYDRHYEDNYLGGAWHAVFSEKFAAKSRLVVALLDKRHLEKIWPTFERDCFRHRVVNSEVIPVRLDDSIFPGIPNDINSIRFNFKGDVDAQRDEIIDDIVLRIAARLEV